MLTFEPPTLGSSTSQQQRESRAPEGRGAQRPSPLTPLYNDHAAGRRPARLGASSSRSGASCENSESTYGCGETFSHSRRRWEPASLLACRRSGWLALRASAPWQASRPARQPATTSASECWPSPRPEAEGEEQQQQHHPTPSRTAPHTNTEHQESRVAPMHDVR